MSKTGVVNHIFGLTLDKQIAVCLTADNIGGTSHYSLAQCQKLEPDFWRNFLLQTLIIYLLMPCPFTGPKMFCAGLNILSQPKNLTAFSASSKPFVPAQKPILLNANHLFVWLKMFVTATISK